MARLVGYARHGLSPGEGFNPDPAPRLRWRRRDLLAISTRILNPPLYRSRVKRPARRTAINRYVSVIQQAKPFLILPMNLAFRRSA